MRKSRTLPQLILFLLLLMQTICAQTPIDSSSEQKNDYGIDPDKQYPGTKVLDLMQTAETEIDASVDEAYSEGYKSAMLLYSPDLEKYKTLYQNEKSKNTLEMKILYGACWFCLGIAGGTIVASAIK